jgi:hypothetical protein
MGPELLLVFELVCQGGLRNYFVRGIVCYFELFWNQCIMLEWALLLTFVIA